MMPNVINTERQRLITFNVKPLLPGVANGQKTWPAQPNGYVSFDSLFVLIDYQKNPYCWT